MSDCHCGRTWPSLVEAHCATCHHHFASVTAFDRHQPTRGGCPDPVSLRDRNGNPALQATDRVDGPVWVTWTSDADRAAFTARMKSRRGSERSGSGGRRREKAPPVVGEPSAPANASSGK